LRGPIEFGENRPVALKPQRCLLLAQLVQGANNNVGQADFPNRIFRLGCLDPQAPTSFLNRSTDPQRPTNEVRPAQRQQLPAPNSGEQRRYDFGINRPSSQPINKQLDLLRIENDDLAVVGWGRGSIAATLRITMSCRTASFRAFDSSLCACRIVCALRPPSPSFRPRFFNVACQRSTSAGFNFCTAPLSRYLGTIRDRGMSSCANVLIDCASDGAPGRHEPIVG